MRFLFKIPVKFRKIPQRRYTTYMYGVRSFRKNKSDKINPTAVGFQNAKEAISSRRICVFDKISKTQTAFGRSHALQRPRNRLQSVNCRRR